MRWIGFGAALLAGLWLCGTAAAQEKPRPSFGRGFAALGGTGRLFLLTQESVQADLKLTEEQKSKVRALQEAQRQLFQDLRNLSGDEIAKRLRDQAEKTEKEISAILRPEQQKRLGQIQLQLQLRRGDYRTILTNPEIAAQLNLTNEQREKIQQLDAEGAKLRASFREGNREEIAKRLQEWRGKYEAILTEQQKSKLKELGGEPFTGEIRFGGSIPLGKPGLRPRKPNP